MKQVEINKLEEDLPADIKICGICEQAVHKYDIWAGVCFNCDSIDEQNETNSIFVN